MSGTPFGITRSDWSWREPLCCAASPARFCSNVATLRSRTSRSATNRAVRPCWMGCRLLLRRGSARLSWAVRASESRPSSTSSWALMRPTDVRYGALSASDNNVCKALRQTSTLDFVESLPNRINAEMREGRY